MRVGHRSTLQRLRWCETIGKIRTGETLLVEILHWSVITFEGLHIIFIFCFYKFLTRSSVDPYGQPRPGNAGRQKSSGNIFISFLYYSIFYFLHPGNHVEGKPGLVGKPTIYNWELIRDQVFFSGLVLKHNCAVQYNWDNLNKQVDCRSTLVTRVFVKGLSWSSPSQQNRPRTEFPLCGRRNTPYRK